MFANGMIGSITKDGLLYMFDAIDVESELNANHPTNGQVWWFNESRDRECAERTFKNRITVNPTAVQHLFGYPEIWE